ncbi:MAG: hypothetical protein ACRDGE_11600 [Candidatus Limnocylindria bacterium]
MANIELSDQELALVRSALEGYLEQFGHEEQDTVRLIQRVYSKLGGEPSTSMTRKRRVVAVAAD